MRKSFCVLALTLISALASLAQENNKMFHQEVTWSPDGKYLSFTGIRNFDPKTKQVQVAIYVMKADGSGLLMVADDAGFSSWSKDGKRLLFSRAVKDSKDADLYSVKKDGSDLIRLTGNAKRNSAPAFSPDGKKIVFTSNRDTDHPQLYVMNSDGSHVKRLTQDSNVGHFNPMWSPDSRGIVYYSEKGDNKDQIWVMNADGTNQSLLTNNVGHNVFPAWVPDGKDIIFSSKREGDSKSVIYMISADGSNLMRVAGITSFFARFSPDGKKIAFIKGEFPSTAIYIVNADGSGETKLTN